jgi:hypothetical protein
LYLIAHRPRKIKRNHIKTLLCGHFALRPYGIGIDRLERIRLLQGNPLVEAFEISVRDPETVSWFLGNFNHKTTQILLEACYAKGNQFPGLQKAVEKEKTKIYYH